MCILVQYIVVDTWFLLVIFKPLNDKLNPNCHLLALLGAHHILHVSRVRVKEDAVNVFVQLRHVLHVTASQNF